MQTLNQRLNIFNQFATDHLQLNSFGIGELWELTEKNGDRIYPLMWTVINTTNINENTELDNYTFVFCDLVRPDESNENEVLSDQKSIAYDFVSFLRFSDAINSGTNVIKQVTLEPFTEKFDDCLSGWIVNVQIKQGFTWDFCSAPMSGNINPEPVCRGVDIYANNVFVETVPSGGRFDYSSGGGDVEVSVNGTLYDTATSPTPLDIPVVNSNGDAVGTVNAGVNVLIEDSQITVKNSEGTILINAQEVPAESTAEIFVGDSLVQNSDLTYSVNLPAEKTLNLPNINFTDTDGTVTSLPSVQDVSATLIPNLTCAQLNDADNGLTNSQRQVIQGIHPLKTGNTVIVRTGDDGDKKRGRLVDWFTLNCNNFFGNTNRFTDTLGTQIYSDGFVLDHATNLMWPLTPFAVDTWNNFIDGASVYTGKGFTDWVSPNDNELFSIRRPLNGESHILSYAPFSLSAAEFYWSSTPIMISTTIAYRLNSANGQLVTSSMASTNKYFYCRYFEPSDF